VIAGAERSSCAFLRLWSQNQKETLMKKAVLAAVLAAVAIPSLPAPVLADPPNWAPAHGRRDRDDRRDHRNDRYDRRQYDANGRYRQPVRLGRNDRVWRGNDGRYYCKRSNGTTGLIIGALAGGALGNVVAGRGDTTLGTLLGAAGGGLLGRSVDRGEVRCR
jgi:hypothetical protein